MNRISLSVLFFAVGLVPACTGIFSSDSPTEGYKRLYAAVKAKDVEAIKQSLTKKSIDIAEFAGIRGGSGPTKMLDAGMTATTYAETLPEIRDERVNGTMGAVEVWNTREKKWEDLPYMLEDGAWKLAVGDFFAGTYQLPGIGRDRRERIAANAANPPGPTTQAGNSNQNTNSGTPTSNRSSP